MGDKTLNDTNSGIVLPTPQLGEGALINRLSESNQAQPAQPSAANESYLETGIDFITSKFIHNDSLRASVDHYGAEFLDTASLFAGGTAGWIAAPIVYGLDQASPNESLGQQAEDFALGATKGAAMKGLFSVVGSNMTFAPTKGIVMGVGMSAAQDIFRRSTFTNPYGTLQQLSTDTFNRQSLLFDAATWTLGEGAFGAFNVASGGALAENQLLGGMAMGASFGVISGGGGEVVKEAQAGKGYSFTKIAEQSLLQGALNGAAAGVGMGLTGTPWGSPQDLSKIQRVDLPTKEDSDQSSPTVIKLDKGQFGTRLVTVDSTDVPDPPDDTKPDPKQYVITAGQDKLDAFRQGKSDSAMLTVRELLKADDGVATKLGPTESLFMQDLGGADDKLLPQADKADLIATSHPENLPADEQAKHVFGGDQGKVWVATDDNNRLLVGLNSQPDDLRAWKNAGFTSATRLDGGMTTFKVMAPLVVGDPKNLDSDSSKAAWTEFDRQLGEAKKLGVESVSTDVWWGLIEPAKGQFDWSYYDKISDHITQAGLKWVPILSFHQCGGNVGDDVNVPIPSWVWSDLGSKTPSHNADDVKFKSEQGHTSNEYISFWADDIAKDNYASVMKAFQDHYAGIHQNISEVNISLGPSGELRYPSYNSHDQNTGYPTRGALQSYSPLAETSFRDFALEKYSGINGVAKAWGINGLDEDHILPPSNPQEFFADNNHINMQYGRDFIDWYNQSLVDHGDRILSLASSIFAAKGAPFSGIDLGAKVPGVHWRVGQPMGNGVLLGDRLAEIDAGLIRTTSTAGFGYRPILSMFREVQPNRNGMDSRIIPSFTCLELPDGDGGPSVQAMPKTLDDMFGQEAERQGLWVKGENALSGTLSNPQSWDLMKGHLDLPGQDGYYHGLTLLRMSDVVNNSVARAKLSELVHAVNSVKPTWQQLFFRKAA